MKKRYVLIHSFLVLLFLATAFPTFATEGGSTTTVTLEKATHFIAAGGSDVLVKPGTYELEAADTWLRLIPGERRDALLVEAEKSTHDEKITEPTAVGVPGEDDEFIVTLLLPGGQSLESIGTYSGVRSRVVKRGRTLSRTRQTSRKPTQTTDISLRVQKLENQVRTLQATINALQSRLTKIESAVQVSNSGKVTVNGTTVKVNAGMVDVQAGISKFSGVVKADTISTNSVISKSYTPGAGNIW